MRLKLNKIGYSPTCMGSDEFGNKYYENELDSFGAHASPLAAPDAAACCARQMRVPPRVCDYIATATKRPRLHAGRNRWVEYRATNDNSSHRGPQNSGSTDHGFDGSQVSSRIPQALIRCGPVPPFAPRRLRHAALAPAALREPQKTRPMPHPLHMVRDPALFLFLSVAHDRVCIWAPTSPNMLFPGRRSQGGA